MSVVFLWRCINSKHVCSPWSDEGLLKAENQVNNQGNAMMVVKMVVLVATSSGSCDDWHQNRFVSLKSHVVEGKETTTTRSRKRCKGAPRLQLFTTFTSLLKWLFLER